LRENFKSEMERNCHKRHKKHKRIFYIFSAFVVLTPLFPPSPRKPRPGFAGRSLGRDWGEEVRTEDERKAE
jgi:hypothetical protein